MRKHKVNLKNLIPILLVACGIVLLHIIGQVNYLLFHVLIEFFTIVIAFSLFIITVNSMDMLDNNYLLIVGISALFIGFLDLLHVLTYPGMTIITPGNFYANQFWIATRFLESITLLSGFLFLERKIKSHFRLIFAIYFFITTIIVLSILILKIFPTCYIEGVGQTKFKIYSEYVIIVILFAALFVLVKKKTHFEKDIYILIAISIGFTILSEYMFTLYFSNFGIFNQFGHYFKFVAFILIYKANIETGFIRPTKVIYHSLVMSQEEIDRYNIQLKEEIATRDRFFSIIAHDLRSPLASIIMASEVMHKKVSQFNTDNLLKYTENIYNISKNTFTLLENLLEWSKFKTGSLTVNPAKFNINDSVMRVVSLYHQIAENKNIELSAFKGPDIQVYADPDMVNSVLRNLISNALKFTSDGGKVAISIDDGEEFVFVHIRDNGTGIKPEKLDTLFDIGHVSSQRGTSNEKGTGLGLMLCRDFVNENGGQIMVESQFGVGSTFTFTLKKLSRNVNPAESKL